MRFEALCFVHLFILFSFSPAAITPFVEAIEYSLKPVRISFQENYILLNGRGVTAGDREWGVRAAVLMGASARAVLMGTAVGRDMERDGRVGLGRDPERNVCLPDVRSITY